MMPNTKFTVLFVTSLLLSFSLGATLGYFVPHPPSFKEGRAHKSFGERDMKKKMLEKMSRKLDLTEDQKEKVRQIFETSAPSMRKLHELTKPRFDEIRNTARTEIRKILTPDQIIKFEELNARTDERMEKWAEKRIA